MKRHGRTILLGLAAAGALGLGTPTRSLLAAGERSAGQQWRMNNAADTVSRKRPNWALRIFVPCAIVGVVVFLMYQAAIGSGPAPTPPIFGSGLTLAQAQAGTGSPPGKALVVANFTASWCGPCQSMKRTSWVSSEVESAVRERGVAVMVDIDEHADDAAKHKIESIPTIVLFKGEQEVARHSGYMSGSTLAAWIAKSAN